MRDGRTVRAAGFAAAVISGVLATLAASSATPAQTIGRTLVILSAMGLAVLAWALFADRPEAAREERVKSAPRAQRPREPRPFAVAREHRIATRDLPRPSKPSARPFAECRVYRMPRPS